MIYNNFTFIIKKIIITLCTSLALLNVSLAQFTVSGKITTEEGEGVKGVTVFSGGPNNESVETDENGFYSLSLPGNNDYTIAPIRDDILINGVSTFDRLLIEKHINNETPITSPYKLIAADINRSGDITNQDIIDIEEAILGITAAFPNNTSWRFVDAEFAFANPQDPFAQVFPEVININSLNGDITDLDFIAVKIGDINATASTGGGGNPSSGALIKGRVYFDENNNCQYDSGESWLQGWTIIAEGSNGDKYYGTTSVLGNYTVTATPGTYDVRVVAPNALWGVCQASITGITITPQNFGQANFAAQSVDTCPYMEVNLTSFYLRRCFNNLYGVDFCNKGTEDATNTSIEVTLDPYFINVTSSIPWSSVNGNTYTFDIGDVPVGFCGSFAIGFELDCSAALGQTHCSSAHIYPEPPCTPVPAQWEGGDLEITGECLGTDVKFTATNHGDDMTEPVNYIVIEDIMIQMTGQIHLDNGQSDEIFKTANGSTWRMQANEVGHHPFETISSAAVEGCGTNGNGTFSLGFVNQYPLSDEEPFEDEDCQENKGSFDPNDKASFPFGYDDERFIERGQDISYLIRFQNTGTDTAFNVMILDTLPANLDPASIRLQGSSHLMEFELMGEGIAKFIFPNIMLPDSNVNEPLSHGFVKFNISQKEGLEIGTTIENEAAIYFDFNDPVITNRTLHTIGEQLIEVTSTEIFVPNVEMNVYPNPFDANATFEINGLEIKNGEINFLNLNGSLVKTQKFQGSKFQFDGSDLPAGIYFFQIMEGGMSVANGKIIVK